MRADHPRSTPLLIARSLVLVASDPRRAGLALPASVATRLACLRADAAPRRRAGSPPLLRPPPPGGDGGRGFPRVPAGGAGRGAAARPRGAARARLAAGPHLHGAPRRGGDRLSRRPSLGRTLAAPPGRAVPLGDRAAAAR